MDKEKNKKTLSKRNISNRKAIIVLRIIIAILLLVATLSTIDIILVNNYKTGPYFAIKTSRKNKSKIYYGFGYKIIKYEQNPGRYDTKVGTWSMKYNDKPELIDITDLAINYVNDVEDTYKIYYGEFIKMEEEIKVVDKTNNIIRLMYNDPDNKYTLAVDFYLYDEKTDISNYKPGDKIKIEGTINGYRNKDSKDDVYTITVKNAFILK